MQTVARRLSGPGFYKNSSRRFRSSAFARASGGPTKNKNIPINNQLDDSATNRMILLSSVMKTISLSQLLSSCMDASQKGCTIIRDFSKAAADGGGTVSGNLKVGGEIKSVVTQADFDAQAAIIGGLRNAWGNDLTIIGEEDDADAKPNMDVTLNLDLLQDLDVEDDELPLEEIALFVDPLDGTREFVEGRLQNVACLIGISRNSRPIAGVIGLPFPDGTYETESNSYYAIADQANSYGSWPTKVTPPPAESSSANDIITILTGDSKDPVLQNATKLALSIAPNPEHKLIGGTAAKLREVATKPNQLAVLHFVTELWDTCAPQAVVANRGGKVTDLFGSPLVHDPKRQFGNIFGVVASSGGAEVTKVHDELCARMRADPESVHKIFGKWMGGDTAQVEAQAMDVSRDLDGLPLDVKWLEKQIVSSEDINMDSKLKGYSVPESGAWRGLMSNGGRIKLEWEQSNDDKLPASVFYKRVVMSDLDHARDKLQNAPHKVVRDVKSYQIETEFLVSQACQEGLIAEAGLRINKVFGSDLRPVHHKKGPKEQLESKFSILLEDFDGEKGWEQKWLLDEVSAKATLQEFAKMHAYFWTGSVFWKRSGGSMGKELEDIVWPNGGYMQPELQGYDQFKNVASGFASRLPTFQEELCKIDELDGIDLDTIGERLQTIVEAVGKKSHPFYQGTKTGIGAELLKYRTLIHGDCKQANIFFRDTEEGALEVGFIDFQWTGFGLAATDVAHHISAALLPSCVSYDGKKENELLDHYYKYLSLALVEFGVASSVEEVQTTIFPRDLLQEQYEIALLDICRMVFAYAWRRWKAESKPSVESLNRNAYNKSTGSALWLITRCSTLLSKYEDSLSG